MKDDPLSQDVAGQVREQMSKHTLWLNAENFDDMAAASLDGLSDDLKNRLWQLTTGSSSGVLPSELWRLMCAAALAVTEWRMGGRVRP